MATFFDMSLVYSYFLGYFFIPFISVRSKHLIDSIFLSSYTGKTQPSMLPLSYASIYVSRKRSKEQDLEQKKMLEEASLEIVGNVELDFVPKHHKWLQFQLYLVLLM